MYFTFIYICVVFWLVSVTKLVRSGFSWNKYKNRHKRRVWQRKSTEHQFKILFIRRVVFVVCVHAERSHCDVIEKSLLRTTNGPWIHYSDDNHVNFPKNEAKNVRLLFHDDVEYKKFNDLIAMATKQNVAFDELIKQMIDK